MNTKKIIIIIAIILLIALIGYLCYGYYQKAFVKVQNPIATMEVEGYGTVKIELYPDIAPNTVTNFICLTNRGFYDGLTFHRVIKDFMIQGGDSTGDGTGSPNLSDIMDNVENDKAYAIKGEFIANGYDKNNLKHEEGVISMARGDYSSLSNDLIDEGYNSAGSQFFIMTKNTSTLNGLYAGFGKVIEGMDVIHKIEEIEVDTQNNDKPTNPPVITSIKVETFGVEYGVPETMDVFDAQSWINQYYGTMLQ